jgi:molybdate transport system substrate-binding protein
MMKKLIRFITLLAFLTVLLAGCGPQALIPVQSDLVLTPVPTTETITVFAAASLTDAFTAIGSQFEAQHPGVKVIFNFAGSQQLAQQLLQGAPADVFASANPDQMQVVVANHRVDSGSVQLFVHNRLVIIFPKDNPADIKTLEDLTKPGLRIVLAAPEVPVGSYSQVFLMKASQGLYLGQDYQNLVLKNVVSYEDNVRFVLAKVALGEADAGIVYTSDINGDNGKRVGQIDIPDDLNVIASYPISAVSDSSLPGLANAFVGFVLSQSGQTILSEFGFIPVSQK